jgi:hypothetical protein
MSRLITAIVVFTFTTLAVFTSPAFAACNSAGIGCGPPGGGGMPGGGPGPTPAPAPIAGAGILYLVAAGGYYAVRRWRSTSKNKL